MALSNIRKNGKIYLPYLITIIGSMMFYYILASMGNNPNIYDITTGKEAFQGATTLCGILQSGSFVATTFVCIFLFYANSFVLKHQKKQLGLYRVLGLERKHLIRIVFTEVILLFGVGLLLGLFWGVLFDKLMLVLLFKIIVQTPPAGFMLNQTALIQTAIVAGFLVVLILLRSLISILATKDIDLLKSEKVGEKEPKGRPLLTLAGIILLGLGYRIAFQSTNVGTAVSNFLPAALLVMLATYALFTSGSISVLKILKKNKKYYYNTKHFISVSGLLYRMKQNAAGLATICILSTGAIIVLSAAAALYANGERSLNEQFPHMIQISTNATSDETVDALLKTAFTEKNIEPQNMLKCRFSHAYLVKTANGMAPESENAVFLGWDQNPDAFIMTLEEYNRFYQTSETLQNNEILLYASDNFFTGETLTYLDETYQIKGTADHSCLKYMADYSMSLFAKLLIVTPNEEAWQKFVPDGLMVTRTGFDSTQSTEELDAFTDYVLEQFPANGIAFNIQRKHQEVGTFYSMYGGVLFVGIALGFLFSLSTVMIIYYKQISGGYEDRERFLIMQKVGLSKQEIKKSIHSQIMLVFFLPLITAIIHSAVALKIVATCLKMFVIVHTPTFIASVIVTCVLFSLVYMLVYKITSKEYYNIVNE